MFTGIIESLGEVVAIKEEGDNVHFEFKAEFTDELKVDQSVSHNGVCLTVTKKDSETYSVTAIKETLKRTNLGELNIGSKVNLERGMKIGDRLDGHIVQGHVDQTAICESILVENGSWIFEFRYDYDDGFITIPKGSITVNGVSLTVVNSGKDSFSVAIIPYTYEHTTFKFLKKGDSVNLEFDIVGKYIAKLNSLK